MKKKSNLEVGLMIPLGTGDSDAPSTVARIVDQARLAEQHELDLVGVGHHILRSRSPWLQPLPALAYLASVTERIKLMTAVLLLPLYNPVPLAEDLATIHLLSRGRFIFGAGIGWRPEEYTEAGLSWPGRASRTEEALEAIRSIWAGNGCTMRGRHFTLDVKGAGLQTPGSPPPIFVAGRSRPAVARAARLGDGWVASSETPLAEFCELAAHYGSVVKAANTGRTENIAVMRNVVISGNRAEALSIAERLWQQRPLWREKGQELFLVGDVNDCAEQARTYLDTGANCLLLTIEPDGLPYADPVTTVELLGSLRALLTST
jgi:alkanesulfonate monooxygenase SsuD/methylene tetrahydromethanopterin reductase-like flavin-dependent oxidoreductase (luciferase family)